MRKRNTRKRLLAAVASKARIDSPLVLLFWIFLALLALSLVWSKNGFAAPNRTDLELERAVWTASEGEIPLVEKRVVRMLQDDSRSAFAHYLMGKLYLRKFMQDPSELSVLRRASELGQQAIELDRASDYGYVVIAEILDIMGQPENATRILDNTLNPQLKPSWRGLFVRARVGADSATNDQVLKLFDQALNQPNSQVDVITPYLVALLQQEYEGELLVAKLEDWNHRHPSNILLHAKAVALAEQKDYKAAHAIYEKIYAKDPRMVESMINDGVLLYLHLARADAGRDLLERVIKSQFVSASEGALPMALSHLGLIYLKRKDFQAARERFVDAIVKSENHFEMVATVAQQYRKEGQPKALVDLVKEINQKLPGEAVFYALLGETFAEELKDQKQSLAAFSDAVALEPERSDYYNGMGLAYYRMNDYNQALFLFSTATRVDPQDATARYNEACVLALIGRRDEALVSLKQALLLDPRLVASARQDADFSSLKASHQFVELTTAEGVAESHERPGTGQHAVFGH